MKTDWSHLDPFRFPHPLTKLMGDHTCGCFNVPHPNGNNGIRLIIIASNGGEFAGPLGGWEHVSVHIAYKHHGKPRERTPTWEEMDHVKRLFWEDTETVMQFHVPRAEHVNMHDHVLHLWRHPAHEPVLPPASMV